MPRLIATSPMPVSQAALFAWHERPGALRRLVPPWQDVRVLSETGGIRDGATVTLRLSQGPLRARWVARHEAYNPPASFRDVQASGPFRRWVHTHECLASGESSTLRDTVDFALPAAPIGPWLAGGFARRQLERTFAFRHARTRADLERIARFQAALPGPARRFGVSGTNGVIGSQLAAILTTAGHDVLRLVRHKPGEGEAMFQPGAGPRGGQIDADALEGLDAVVHLSGEPVASGRWTRDKMALVRESRVEGTRLIAGTLAGLKHRPRVLVVASGTGLYGDRGDQELHEDAGVGSGFFAELARDWEAAAEPARQAGIRVVHLRYGAVLAASGGLLRVLRPFFALGFGAIPGPGSQWWPWVSLDDALSATLHAIAHDDLQGPANVVSPNPCTAREFCVALARVLDRPLFATIPAPLIRWTTGARAEWATASARAVPAALRATDFRFAQPTLDSALALELGLASNPDVSFAWD